MLHHFSIAADDPHRVARVLAEVLGGAVIPFPPHPGSYFALALDAAGTGVVVCPAGIRLEPGEDGFRFVDSADRPSYSAFHCAVSVALDARQIEAIGRREGWRVVNSHRGDFFEPVELWLENRTLLELLPPEQTERYRQFMTPEQLRQFGAEFEWPKDAPLAEAAVS